MNKSFHFTIKNIPAKRPGKIILEDGRQLKDLEAETIRRLLPFSENIFCKKESRIQGQHTADIFWRNEIWEVKGMKIMTEDTVHDCLRRGKAQGRRLIIDVTKCRVPFERSLRRLAFGMRRHSEIICILAIYQNKYCIIERDMIK